MILGRFVGFGAKNWILGFGIVELIDKNVKISNLSRFWDELSILSLKLDQETVKMEIFIKVQYNICKKKRKMDENLLKSRIWTKSLP